MSKERLMIAELEHLLKESARTRKHKLRWRQAVGLFAGLLFFAVWYSILLVFAPDGPFVK
jgi:hypothetical protein